MALTPTTAQIWDAARQVLGTPEDDWNSRSHRPAEVARLRQLAYYAAHTRGKSTRQIARALERDRSTIKWGVGRAKHMLAYDSEWQTDLKLLEEGLPRG